MTTRSSPAMQTDRARMYPARVLGLTALAMLAFAGNSLLCRMALKQSTIDAASFTSVRLIAGAAALGLILRFGGGGGKSGGNWLSAAALFVYAAGFSWAYISLPAGTGALLLFGAVQVTMIGNGLWHGERLRPAQTLGLLAACGGLMVMLLPGVHAPSLRGSMLMLCAGVAWGLYSLRGRGVSNPLGVTAGNFWRASVMTLAMSALLLRSAELDVAGVAYAVASGALASGVGYAIWYTAIRGLAATSAASIQLTVPVIAALGAIVLLGEPITWHLVVTSVVVLGGVALVIVNRPGESPASRDNSRSGR
jgi:drug/metabolite transporter (DMT)-like permease